MDPEEYYDFQVNRPKVSMVEGERAVQWPTTRVLLAQGTPRGRDVLLVLGIEPSVRWRSYSAELLAYAVHHGATLLVTLADLLADVPHTRPIPVSVTSEDPSLRGGRDIERSSYEGPTGIVGVIADQARQLDLPALSCWAAVPHYARRPALAEGLAGPGRPAGGGARVRHRRRRAGRVGSPGRASQRLRPALRCMPDKPRPARTRGGLPSRLRPRIVPRPGFPLAQPRRTTRVDSLDENESPRMSAGLSVCLPSHSCRRTPAAEPLRQGPLDFTDCSMLPCDAHDLPGLVRCKGARLTVRRRGVPSCG